MSARSRILNRRAKLVAAALAGGGVAASACGPSVCLSPSCEKCEPVDASKDQKDDMMPQPCLTAPFDSGIDTGSDAPVDAPSDSPSDAPNDGEGG